MSRVSLCNGCGKPLDIWDKRGDFSLRRKLGYGTRYDGKYLSIRLCCECIENIISECEISPIFSHDDETIVS